MRVSDTWPIVREGVWLYAGSVPVSVRIVLSDDVWGTGDYEDPEFMREGRDERCYFIVYEMAGAKGGFRNLIPDFSTLELAQAHAERKFIGIQWLQ